MSGMSAVSTVPDSSLRERILDVARRLVLERGFSATSVADILDEVQASKGAFFHHFPSKVALGHALVRRYADADAAALDQALLAAEAASDDPADQLVALLRVFEQAADPEVMEQPGCLFVSFVYEQAAAAETILPLVTDSVALWRRRILDKLELAAAAGRLPADVDLPSLADQVFTVFEGSFILARATGESGRVRAQLTHLRRYFELLLGANGEG
jgi:TetR/AcrR family transcriptional regulator, transcriptional repressor for nem operon